MIGKTIKRLRLREGLTQEQLAARLHLSGQAVSKWENEATFPDITTLPLLADCFGVTIDELMGYKLRVLTHKDRFIKFMADSGILQFDDTNLKSPNPFYLNTEHFVTNAQIARIGEFFADCIQENHLAFDAIIGLAYHGISFSIATAYALFQKYGVVTNCCYDRKVTDSRGRWLCGYTPQEGDKVIIVDDQISSGQMISERIARILTLANVQIEAIVVIADRMNVATADAMIGSRILEETYHTKVYSMINEKDIEHAIRHGVIHKQ